jgi:hypothetical protein
MTLTHAPQGVADSTAAFPQAAGYPRAGHARIVLVPERRVLAIDGEGEPGGPAFQEAMGAIYGVAYGLLFLLRDRGIEAHVPPVEALWTRREGEQDWAIGPVAFDPSAWRWTLLMPVPETATQDDIGVAVRATAARNTTGAACRLEVRWLSEGLVVEAMHVGPYDTEPETIAAMHAHAAAFGLAPHGAHHEIYLGDPRRARPERLRTVLRQPVR